jgi:hypothetical protein
LDDLEGATTNRHGSTENPKLASSEIDLALA